MEEVEFDNNGVSELPVQHFINFSEWEAQLRQHLISFFLTNFLSSLMSSLFQTLPAMTVMSSSNCHFSSAAAPPCWVHSWHARSVCASLVRWPRWQLWAPGLDWLSGVWFPFWSQSEPARPYSWFTSFAFPSFPNIISVSHLFISLPAVVLSQMGRFSNKQVRVLISIWFFFWVVLGDSKEHLALKKFGMQHKNVFTFSPQFYFDVLCSVYCWSRVEPHV